MRKEKEKDYLTQSIVKNEEGANNSLISFEQGRDKLSKNEGFDYILEEINEVQTNLVNFFTIMFKIGIILIPIQIIVYEDIKTYEIDAIIYLQSSFGIGKESSTTIWMIKLFLGFSSINFLSSLNIFIYYFTDTMIAFKASLMLGSCSFLVYALKLLVHDSRPFWINEMVLSLRCKTSFGCPAFIFTGMFLFNYLIFNISKMNNDKKLDQLTKRHFNITEILSLIYILIILSSGFILILFGENFIYQIICSFCYVYVLLRIVIIFDELINYYAKNASIKETISRVFAFYLFILIILLSIFSLFFYSITSYDLQIPLNWSQNISVIIYLLFRKHALNSI